MTIVEPKHNILTSLRYHYTKYSATATLTKLQYWLQEKIHHSVK